MSNPSRALEKEALLRKKQELMYGLPHLYGWKWYTWAKEFFESRNKFNFICAANQISKSSTQIRKCIDWATNQEKWPQLWRTPPTQFWYLYPTKDVARIEFETKWSQFLPRGEFQKSGKYGWTDNWRNKELFSIEFNSGVRVYFKTYAQDPQHLQSGTCDAIFCDEELPLELYDELLLRLAASDGYFHMVFTATLGQEFWRAVIEEKGEHEKLKGAFKKQVSMFDCLYYEDGSKSHWTEERIQRIINQCKSQAEVLRRVYGRFVVDSGRKYEAFDRAKNVKKKTIPHAYPPGWAVYAGIDLGSGGERHPAAIAFVAVSPEYTRGVVFRGWRGDGELTTNTDVLNKYIELKGRIPVTAAYYDHGSKDFFTIATRAGIPVFPANKSHEAGEQIVNSLFRNQMLDIYDEDFELEKLCMELSTFQIGTPKHKARNDFCDALRYAVTSIPWDWSQVSSDKPVRSEETPLETSQGSYPFKLRDGERIPEQKPIDLIDLEIQEWNEAYGH